MPTPRFYRDNFCYISGAKLEDFQNILDSHLFLALLFFFDDDDHSIQGSELLLDTSSKLRITERKKVKKREENMIKVRTREQDIC